MGLARDCDFSSTVTSISNIFVVCELDKGLFLMKLSVVCITPLLGMKYLFVVIYYLLTTSMFLLILSRLFEVGKVIAKGPSVIPGFCLFCLLSLFVRTNILTVADE